MTITILIAAVALLGLIAVYVIARGAAGRVASIAELQGRTAPVDMQAVRNLLDPGERAFLEANLAAADFRRVERERARAAREYVGRIAANAAILLRLGQATSADADPQVARTGQEIAALAFRVRVNALLAGAELAFAAVLPGTAAKLGGIAAAYERLSGTVSTLARLQEPAAAPRLVAIL